MADSNKDTKSPLTRDEVIQLAEENARSEGIELQDYNITGCHYEFFEEHTGTVFFEMKPPTPSGGRFTVSVNDRTKLATLMYDE